MIVERKGLPIVSNKSQPISLDCCRYVFLAHHVELRWPELRDGPRAPCIYYKRQQPRLLSIRTCWLLCLWNRLWHTHTHNTHTHTNGCNMVKLFRRYVKKNRGQVPGQSMTWSWHFWTCKSLRFPQTICLIYKVFSQDVVWGIQIFGDGDVSSPNFTPEVMGTHRPTEPAVLAGNDIKGLLDVNMLPVSAFSNTDIKTPTITI